MQHHGIAAREGVGDWIVRMEIDDIENLVLDYEGGNARASRRGRSIHPRVVHFHSHRSQPLYCREKYRVRNPSGWWSREVASRVVGYAESFTLRLKRKLKPSFAAGWIAPGAALAACAERSLFLPAC